MTDGPLTGVLFVVFLLAVLALFATAIVSADRFVRTLPPHPGRKHGVVRRFSVRQLGRIARVIRAPVLLVWRAVPRVVHATSAALQTERRARMRAGLTRVTHWAIEVGFGGPPDEVECERQVRPRFEGRHARPAVAGEERRRPRRFRARLAPHDALALVMRTPAVGQRDAGSPSPH